MMSDELSRHTETKHQAFPPLTLHAEGFTLTITPLSPYRDPVCDLIFFNGMVSLQTEAPVEKHLRETFMECYLSDLDRLRKDMEAHLDLLKQRRLFERDDPVSVGKHIDAILTEDDIESKTWVPLELEVWLTCQDGEMWYEGDILAGNFYIRVMLQAQMQAGAKREAVRMYIGYEGSVDIQEVMTFCDALRSCVTHYEQL